MKTKKEIRRALKTNSLNTYPLGKLIFNCKKHPEISFVSIGLCAVSDVKHNFLSKTSIFTIVIDLPNLKPVFPFTASPKQA